MTHPRDDEDDHEPTDRDDRSRSNGEDHAPPDGGDRDPGDGGDHAPSNGGGRDPGDRTIPDPDDEGGRESGDGDGPPRFVQALVDLLQEVADDRGPGTRNGIDRIGGASVDFSITAGSLADHFGPPPLETDDESDPYVTTRETPDGCLVVADLQGITSDDLSTRIDEEAGELVISVGERTVGRIPLDDPNLDVTDARFNNDVLEVRLARER